MLSIAFLRKPLICDPDKNIRKFPHSPVTAWAGQYPPGSDHPSTQVPANRLKICRATADLGIFQGTTDVL